MNELQKSVIELKKDRDDEVLLPKVISTSMVDRVNRLESLAAENKLKIKVLTNIVIRQEEKIELLQDQLKFQKRSKLRQNVVVSGLIEEKMEMNDELKDKTNKFFKDQLELQTEVKVVVGQ